MVDGLAKPLPIDDPGSAARISRRRSESRVGAQPFLIEEGLLRIIAHLSTVLGLSRVSWPASLRPVGARTLASVAQVNGAPTERANLNGVVPIDRLFKAGQTEPAPAQVVSDPVPPK